MTLSGAHIINSDTQILLNWGANFKPLTLDGEYWRLFTSFFLHIGIIHLLFNMYALFYIGSILEPLIGRKHFTIAFLLTGLLGSVVSLWWNDLVVSAGASGAIFGLYGVYIALITTNLVTKQVRKKLLGSMAFFVGFNLLYGMQAGIDNAAHIGGLLSGTILGFTFYPFLAKPYNNSRNDIIFYGVVSLLLALSYFTVTNSDNGIKYYDQIMSKFGEYEEKAMAVYELPENSTDEFFLEKIEKDGLPNWFLAQETLTAIDSLENLPKVLKERVDLLEIYTGLRIKIFELIKLSIINETKEYNDEIAFHNKKINLLVQKIQGNNIADSLINEEYKIPSN